MFCPKCGTQLPDGAEFCSACGNDLRKRNTTVSAKNKLSSKSDASRFNKRWAFAAVAIIILIIIIALIRSCGSGSSDGDISAGSSSESKANNNKGNGNTKCEMVLDKYGNAMLSKNVEAYIDCFPSEMSASLESEYKKYRGGELIKSQFAFVDDVDQYQDRHYDYSFSYSNVTQLPDGEIKRLRSKYSLDIDEACSADVKYSCSYESMGGTATTSKNKTVYIGKIGNSWYMLSGIDDYIANTGY